MAKYRLYNSYAIPKAMFPEFIAACPALDRIVEMRGYRSVSREWACHKFLFNLGIARARTKDCDFEAPIKWYAELGYFLMGWCRVFIK